MGISAMTWKTKEISQEEIDRYKVLVVEFIEKTKGWKSQEYSIRYVTTLEDAPLSAFNVIRHDAREEMRKADGFGLHPTGEIQVFLHTQEMRAFAEYEEFKRIREEAKNKVQ